MTYTSYSGVLNKAITVGYIFKSLDERLARIGPTWTARQTFEAKCYAQDAREFFTDILDESLRTSEDYRIDEGSYPAIYSVYPFTKPFGDPFFSIIQEGTLESVEKLACLILFSEHIVSFCESSRIPTLDSAEFQSDDESGLLELIHAEFDSDSDLDTPRDISPSLHIEIELDEKLSLRQPEEPYDHLGCEIDDILELVSPKPVDIVT